MSAKATRSGLLIHSHLHNRVSGVTRHVESMVAELSQHMETTVVGSTVDPQLPSMGWREVIASIGKKPIVWHAHRNNELLLGLLLRPFGKNFKIVFTRHNHRPAHPLTRFLAKRADHVVALTQEVAQGIQCPSSIVGHGVDLARFWPPQDRQQTAQKLGLKDQLGIGVVGRVRPSKGQGDFVEAIAPLLPVHKEVTPVLVGLVQDRYQTWLDELVARTEQRLLVVGQQDNVVPWYQGLSIVVLPSHAEGFSLVLLEAMACGACVVAAKLPHFPDLVEHGRTGFLYSPGDIDGLREILQRLIGDPALIQQVGNSAAQHAKEYFGASHEAEQLVEIYDRLLQER